MGKKGSKQKVKTGDFDPNEGRRTRARHGDGAKEVRVPKDKEFGNSKQDQAWLEEQVNLGMIEDIDEDESDVPFGAMIRWTGDPTDIGSHWQLPPEGRRCTGRAKVRDKEGRAVSDRGGDPLYRPCTRWAIRGGRVCVAHGGGIEKVKAAAKLRLVASADVVIGALLSIALDPKQDAKARVQAINSALDRAGIKAGVEISLETPEWQTMLKDMFGEWGGSDGEDAGSAAE